MFEAIPPTDPIAPRKQDPSPFVDGSEIVFAMVAAVGVNLKLAEDALIERLTDYGYPTSI